MGKGLDSKLEMLLKSRGCWHESAGKSPWTLAHNPVRATLASIHCLSYSMRVTKH